MRLLTQKESDLVKTFALTLKMKNHQKIIDFFKGKFDEEPQNIDNVFNYGLCMSVYIGLDPDHTCRSKHQLAANKAFTECLNQRGDWWLARYLRSMVNQELSDGLVAMSLSFNPEVYQKFDPDLDRRILIDQQNKYPTKLPYFLCPYLYQAKSYIYKGLIEEAIEIYRSGIQAIPAKLVVFCNDFLIQPFYDVIICFRKLNMTELAEEIKEVALVLFPTSKMLLMT